MIINQLYTYIRTPPIISLTKPTIDLARSKTHISGTISDGKKDHSPFTGVTVILMPGNVKIITDADGGFQYGSQHQREK